MGVKTDDDLGGARVRVARGELRRPQLTHLVRVRVRVRVRLTPRRWPRSMAGQKGVGRGGTRGEAGFLSFFCSVPRVLTLRERQ